MCGRYTLTVDRTTLSITFPEFNIPENLTPRFNIAPTQPVPVVANTDARRVELYKWGLIPFWAKDPAVGNKLINARAESLYEKPSFKHAYRRRRCVIFADGFYEWYRDPNKKAKVPMRIRMQSGQPFVFAGLWESWCPEDAPHVLTCTIITTRPNELMKRIHNRMPVILPPEAFDEWLDPAARSPDRLNTLLQPFDAAQMTAYPVSTMVNNPSMDTPACIEPVEEADLFR